MMFGHSGFGWIGMLLGLVIAVAIIIGLVWLAVTIIQRADKSNLEGKAHNAVGQTPREIAAMRYAKGEISREEYQKIVSDLTN